jgi:NAD(P)-dependent dehydrogenase (short-subunit alcohol dehydrogenase family)
MNRKEGMNMGQLDNKVAIITGAGSNGMGRATAMLFAAEGAKVVVSDISQDGGEETVRIIKEAGGEAVFVRADVSRSADVQRMVNTAVETYGRLDILFNNAAIFGPPGLSIADYDEETWDEVINVDLKGVFLGMKYSIPVMINGGGGVIINNASVSGLRANPGGGIYGTAKAGVIHLTKVAALEYGALNIRVNSICPFGIKPMRDPSIPRPSRVVRTPEEEEERWKRAQLPMKRTGKPEEIAQTVLFLASDQSSWINGAAIPVDGASAAGYFGRFR